MYNHHEINTVLKVEAEFVANIAASLMARAVILVIIYVMTFETDIVVLYW